MSGVYFPEHQNFSEGLVAISNNGKVGFMDNHGNIAIECIYDNDIPQSNDENIYKFIDGIAIVKKNGNYIGIDKYGNEILHLGKYVSVEGFSEGLALVQDSNYNYGYIDTKGNEVIKCKFGFATSFENGYAVVSNNGKKTKVNKRGWSMKDSSEIVIGSISGILMILTYAFIKIKKNRNS